MAYVSHPRTHVPGRLHYKLFDLISALPPKQKVTPSHDILTSPSNAGAFCSTPAATVSRLVGYVTFASKCDE